MSMLLRLFLAVTYNVSLLSLPDDSVQSLLKNKQITGVELDQQKASKSSSVISHKTCFTIIKSTKELKQASAQVCYFKLAQM